MQPASMRDVPSTTAPDTDVEIRLRDVRFTYGSATGAPPILEKVSLDIARGEFVVIVGPSGCGKTTMLSLMGGLLEAEQGKVVVGAAAPASQHHRMGYMPARHALLPWRTALANVALPLEGGRSGLGKQERRDVCRRALTRVGLTGYENYHPHELSQGMRQRVSLARALAGDPAILLMDEPFGALDSQTKARVQGELLATWENSARTAVFISHDLQEAILLADRVIVMAAQPGRIILDRRIDIARPRAGRLRQLVTTDAFKTCYEEVLGVITQEELARAEREIRS